MQLFNLLKSAQQNGPNEADKTANKKRDRTSKPIRTVVEEEEFIVEVDSNSDNHNNNNYVVEYDDQIKMM